MINVTKSTLPPVREYLGYLLEIWRNGQLTNFGPFCRKLESELTQYLKAQSFFYVTNGTAALQLAIKSLEKRGEIITTPFSFVATTSSIVWEGCTPVFVDIEPDTLTLDPQKIEAAITDNTIAILATHVYGNPCDVLAIEKIAQKHAIKVIYDAAHTFGVHYLGKPLANYGDISTLSFHATKLFHTVEGGGVVTANAELAHKIDYMRNFGLNGPEAFYGLGINAKGSELHAAMGLCNLHRVKKSIELRKERTEFYDKALDPLLLSRPTIRPGTDYNYAYYPVIFDSEAALLQALQALSVREIHPRRYFYPSLNQLDYVAKSTMPIAEDVSRRILCLPMYDELSFQTILEICDIIHSALSRKAA